MISYDDLTREEMISLLAAQQSTVQELLARVSQLEASLNQPEGPSSGGPPSAGSARVVPHFVKPNTKSKDSVRRKKRSSLLFERGNYQLKQFNTSQITALTVSASFRADRSIAADKYSRYLTLP